MASRLFLSRVRGALRSLARSSSPGITVKGAPASAGPVASWNEAAAGMRNAHFHAEGRAASTRSAFDRSRGLHNSEQRLGRSSLPGIVVQGSMGLAAGRGARRFHVLRDAIVEHGDGAIAALSVVVFAGLLYVSIDADDRAIRFLGIPVFCIALALTCSYLQTKLRKMITTERHAYRRTHELMEEMERETAAYSTSMPDKKAVVQEFMEEDEAMRARFEEWMKEYGRTYNDEVEKARRFKIFKSVAKCVDVANAEAAQAGHSTRFGLNEFSDWNAEEMSRLFGAAPVSDEEYLKMVKPYLVAQGIWDKVSKAMNQREHKK